jgi:hypothetical protein
MNNTYRSYDEIIVQALKKFYVTFLTTIPKPRVCKRIRSVEKFGVVKRYDVSFATFMSVISVVNITVDNYLLIFINYCFISTYYVITTKEEKIEFRRKNLLILRPHSDISIIVVYTHYSHR